MLASEHEVWVLTHIDNREGIEQAETEGKSSKNVRFVYHGRKFHWHPNRLIARLQSWLEYHRWNASLLAHARTLHGKIGFDLAHHLTYATWRIPSPLWQLSIPFIWGPVGGVATYPLHLLSKLSWPSQGFELARTLSNHLCALTPAMRQCIRNSTVIVASNEETRAFMARIRGHSRGLHVLSAASFTEAALDRFCKAHTLRDFDAPLRLFAGGNLIGSKGIIFSLEALAQLHQIRLPFHFTIASWGPEAPFLKKRITQLNLDEVVGFHPGFSGQAYVEALGRSHIFFLPSFRENAPVTILEAMLTGCVPVAVDASAQGEIIRTTHGGIAVSVGSAREIVEGLSACLKGLHEDRDRLRELSSRARKAIAQRYHVNRYKECMQMIYAEALQSSSGLSEGVHKAAFG
jgi:glycosyltransferase involved in cell wall biosynthesis